MKIARLALVIAASTCLFLASCAAPKTKVTKIVPANSHEASRLRKVAVLPLEGRAGASFTTQVEAVLASITIGDRPYFTVIERNQLTKVMEELKLGQSGLVNPDQAADIGNLLGAQGIYMGRIDHRVTDSPYTEERSECVQYKTTHDRKGREVEGPCIRYAKKRVKCAKRDAVVSFTPKLVEVETSRIVYSRTLTGTVTAKGCPDKGKPLPAQGEMLGRAAAVAKGRFKADIAPHPVTLEVRIMDSKDGIGGSDASEKLSQGIDFAKNDRMDRACELWAEGLQAAPASPSLLYNGGLCAELAGDPDKAIALYRKADRAIGKPDKDVTVALARVGAEIKDRKKLAEQVEETAGARAEGPDSGFDGGATGEPDFGE